MMNNYFKVEKINRVTKKVEEVIRCKTLNRARKEVDKFIDNYGYRILDISGIQYGYCIEVDELCL